MPDIATLPPPALPATLRMHWVADRGGAVAEDVARVWLAQALGCPPIAVALVRDALGRPRLSAGQRRFDVNWSHSGSGLLIGLGQDLQVGVDLECARARPNALALARRFFTPDESRWLAGLPAAQQESAFLRLWCAKEAVLKAHGRGLAFGLDRLEFAERGGALALIGCERLLGHPAEWSLREFEPEVGYRAAIAWRDRPAPAV
ncbi:MAG: 4'-phosphopantetheinyl transferase family protein [Luteimonas sp.]